MNGEKMKEYNIDLIEGMDEKEARNIALESMRIKEYNIYFVDFNGYFGYSRLVYKNNHHIYHANDYELHHSNMTRENLRKWYIDGINNILFTEQEIVKPLIDYSDYKRRKYFLNNIYIMQVDYISIFGNSEMTESDFKKKIKNMYYDPCAFAYVYDKNFMEHHIKLDSELEKRKNEMSNNYNYYKSAFLYEMANHEYHINWQGDFDVLSAFGNIEYLDDDEDYLDKYFKQLSFTDVQKQAYIDARIQYYKDLDCY